MGNVETGILSPISGQVGPVVGAILKTKNVIRKRPTKSTKPPKQSQINQRSKFTLIATLIRVLSSLIKIGYQSNKGLVSPRNAAMSYHLKNAITGVSPDFAIDFSKVVISKGNLDNGLDLALTNTADREMEISWTMGYNAEEQIARSTDLAYAAFYSELQNKYLHISGTASREDLKTQTTVPRMFAGETLHVYVFFVSADGNLVSDSQYMGGILIPA